MLDAVERLDREEYDVPAMMAETFHDLDQIVHFLDEARKFEPKHDDKLQKFTRLLNLKEIAGQKALIKRLRPLSTKQPWGIFVVKFEPKRLPVVALRRILSQVALKKRASANSAERAAWAGGILEHVGRSPMPL